MTLLHSGHWSRTSSARPALAHSRGRSIVALTLVAITMGMLVCALSGHQGITQPGIDPSSGRPFARIVGVGAASCPEYPAQIQAEPRRERDYLAWAQGFMSGALMRSEEDAGRGLDLSPTNFPLSRQAEFLRNFCLERSDASFAEGVITLYRKLSGAPI